jgi:hypothetical protein
MFYFDGMTAEEVALALAVGAALQHAFRSREKILESTTEHRGFEWRFVPPLEEAAEGKLAARRRWEGRRAWHDETTFAFRTNM